MTGALQRLADGVGQLLQHGRAFIAALSANAAAERRVADARRERRAEEGRAPHAIAPGLLGRLADADARARNDVGRLQGRSHPQGRPVERGAVEVAVDAQRLAKLAGTGAKLAQGLDPAAGPHRLNPVQRLQRPDQDRAAPALASHQVHAPVQPVGAVNVEVTDGAEHDGVASGQPPVAVRGGVLVMVGLRLHDRAADAAHPEPHAEERARDGPDVAREEAGRQRLRDGAQISQLRGAP